MKKKLLVNLFFCLSLGFSCAQTTATDFTTNDCNGVSHNLFSEIDAGNVIVIAFIMPCPPCAVRSLPAYYAAQSFANTHPGRVHFYIADDYGDGSCAGLSSYDDDMPISTLFCSPSVSMSDYSSLATGMPKVVVLGGSNRAVYLNQDDDKIEFTSVQLAIEDALSDPSAIQQSVSTKFNLSTYPNPVNSILNVSYSINQSDVINFTIVDVLGKVVLSSEENLSYSIKNSIKSIDVSTLNDGSYFLEISSGNIVENIPFIVSH